MMGPRREGDVAEVYADPKTAAEHLGKVFISEKMYNLFLSC